MKNIQIISLVGKDVAGLRADLRSRNADGSLRYPEQREQREPRLTTLKRVHIKREQGKQWLYWEWEKCPAIPFDCGYSGVRLEDGKPEEYHIEMEPLA